MTQKNLTEFTESHDSTAFETERDLRDEWGPTMHRPIPDSERYTIQGSDGIDGRRLPGTGLAPSDYEILNGAMSPKHAAELGFHPDDEHRPDQYKQESQKIQELETMTPETTKDDSTQTKAAAVTDGGTNQNAYECELCGDQPAENRLGDGETMLCDECDEEPDGGRYNPADTERGAKPWTEYEPGDEVRVIEKPAVGLMCSPSIIEGSVSSSGKSVMVGPDEGLSSKTRRLDAETIMQGDWEFRDSTSYELYTPGRYRNTQRANHEPGPQSGANEITDAGDLPTPTHWPQGEHGEDVPEECPACGETPAHWQTERKARPMCEACGELAPDKQDDQDDSEQDETVEKWDLSRLDRGDVLTLDGHRGEFLITRINYFRGTKTVNRLDAATVEGGEWTTYTLSKLDSMQGRRLRVKLDDAETTPFVDVNDDSHARDFEQIRNDTELLRRYIKECYYGDDSDDTSGGGSDGGDGDDPDDGTDNGRKQLVTDGGQDVNGCDGFTVEELARDASEPRREIGNATLALWNIDTDELTARESSRLSTILGKLDELENIIQEREEHDLREQQNGGDGA